MTPKMNAIGILVADMKVAVDFYERLGLSFSGEGDHMESELPGGLRVMLDTHDMARSIFTDWSPPAPDTPRVAFAFELPSAAEVDAKFAELAAAGVEVTREPWDAVWGQRYAILRDPDGNGIDLYASLKSTVPDGKPSTPDPRVYRTSCMSLEVPDPLPGHVRHRDRPSGV